MRYSEDQYELLLRSLEEELSQADQGKLAAALEQSAELRRERKALLRLRAQLRDLSAPPDPAFADRLQLRLERSATPVIHLQRYAYSILAACLVLLLGVCLSLYGMEGGLSTEILVGIQDLSPEDAYTLINY
jgi:hypothetical protein